MKKIKNHRYENVMKKEVKIILKYEKPYDRNTVNVECKNKSDNQ
jgi:hypothetical protein